MYDYITGSISGNRQPNDIQILNVPTKNDNDNVINMIGELSELGLHLQEAGNP